VTEDWTVEHDDVLPFLSEGVRESFGPEARRREAERQARRPRLVIDSLPRAEITTGGSDKPVGIATWHLEYT